MIGCVCTQTRPRCRVPLVRAAIARFRASFAPGTPLHYCSLGSGHAHQDLELLTAFADAGIAIGNICLVDRMSVARNTCVCPLPG